MGALPLEVTAMNSLTANLHLLMMSFYRPTPERQKIFSSRRRPSLSDRYVVESQIRFHGFDPEESMIEARTRKDELVIRMDDLLELIEREGESIALILWRAFSSTRDKPSRWKK